MNGSIQTDHIQQVGRAHGPAELLHDFIDVLEVSTLFNQEAKAAKVREEYPVDQEAGAVVNHNRRFAHCPSIGHGGSNGGIRGLLTTDDFYQRHAVYGVEEVHTAEIFRPLEVLRQAVDGNRRSVRGENGIFAHHPFHFGQYGVFDFGVFNHRFDNEIDIAKISVGERRANIGQLFRHLLGGQLFALYLLGK